MSDIRLGQTHAYESQYNRSLLNPIARVDSRQGLPSCPWHGVDLWTAYELSWLDHTGKPLVAVAEFRFPADSPNIIESKSLKYYLNGFNQTAFASREAVVDRLTQDLSDLSGEPVAVTLYSLEAYGVHRAQALVLGRSIDDLALASPVYQPNREALMPVSGSSEEQVWASHLLKTNCPVTGQPDWASVWFGFTGNQPTPESLLAYVVSFREHQDFHEHSVERMFADLWAQIRPERLWVYARYTRRGGLDINPFRSSEPMAVPHVLAVRQ